MPTDSLSYHLLDVTSEGFSLGFLADVLDGFAYRMGAINLKSISVVKPEDILGDYRVKVLGVLLKYFKRYLSDLELFHIVFLYHSGANGIPVS